VGGLLKLSVYLIQFKSYPSVYTKLVGNSAFAKNLKIEFGGFFNLQLQSCKIQAIQSTSFTKTARRLTDRW
jgi:hypothetical protein